MAEQRMKVRDKKVQKMTKDGLVEENLTDKSSVRVSNRASDVQMGRKQGEKEENLVDKSPRQSERSGKNIRPSVQKSRDAPELIRTEKQSEDFGQSSKQQNRKRIRAEVGKESRLAEKSEVGQLGRLKDKRADLSENRGDSRRNQTGGSKKPKQKQRLKFAYEETGASVKNDKDMEKLNQMDTDGVNFRHQKQKEKAKKFSYEEAKKKKEAKQHSKKAQVYRPNEGEAPGKKKSRLKFGEGESVKTEKISAVKKAGSATSIALHREISKNEDDNAAVEGAHKLEESGEGVYRLEQRSARRRKQRASRKRSRLERQAEKQTQAAARQEQKKLKKQIQKQQIKRDYAKAKRSEQTVGTAAKGTIDYIKKIGGKVTNFFKENRKVYISVAVLIGLMFLIITNVTSCSAVFLQNVITYTGTSYLSSDQAIREAELYYTQLEANLQERINNMESEEPGHDEYRYDIGPIEHDPFILISYLSAKYEEFTFEQVKPELDALFAEQYHLTTEAVNETVTETATVRVGESLGQVVTSGYCNCPICCGIWSGGPTASGAYPTANHTLAVDASNPFVPMGTKVVMNGVEYTVEDTGAFARYGVQFDVYYDSHAAASAHGHQIWECYLADDNGSNEVEVTRTRDSLLMAQIAGRVKEIIEQTKTSVTFDEILRQILNNPTGEAITTFVKSKQNILTSENVRTDDFRIIEKTAKDTVYIFFHTALGTTNCYRFVEKELRKEDLGDFLFINVEDVEWYYSIQYHELVDRITDEYVRKIEQLHYKNINLIGYCLGGILALNVAVKLLEKGIEVNNLFVIDSYPVSGKVEDQFIDEVIFLPNYQLMLSEVLEDVDDFKVMEFITEVRKRNNGNIPKNTFFNIIEKDTKMKNNSGLWEFVNSTKEKRFEAYAKAIEKKTCINVSAELLEATFEIYQHGFKGANVELPFYSGDICYLSACEEQKYFFADKNQNLEMWNDICLGEFEVINVPGNHVTCIHSEENATLLAQIIIERNIRG